MQVVGYINMLKCFTQAHDNFEKSTKSYLNRVGKKFLKKVKLKTPVDTGTLRRSWNMEQEKYRVSIGTNVKYAPYVEHDHRSRAGSLVEGRYMLKKTFEEVEKDLEDEFEILIKDLWG